jgi:hypothetical protein
MPDYRAKSICILGMHRSGTSAVTRSINLLGAYLGRDEDIIPANFDNPEGFWENSKIVNLHDRILESLNAAWDSNTALPDYWWEKPEISFYKESLKELIIEEFGEYSLWVWKDPRTCLLLPLWKSVFEQLNIELDIVFVIRNPLEVSKSLEYRNGYEEHIGLAMWTYYTLSALQHCEGTQITFIHFDRFLEQPIAILEGIANQMSWDWPDPEGLERYKVQMETFIKPTLRHTKARDSELLIRNNVPSVLKETYQLLLEFEQSPDTFEANSGRITTLYKQYSEYSRLLRSMSHKPFTVKIYVKKDEGYSEKLLYSTSAMANGERQQLKIPIRSTLRGEFRVDPSDIPSYIRIESIDVLDSHSMNIIHSWNYKNHFEGIREGYGIDNLQISDTYSFLSRTNDPQLLLEMPIEVTGPTLQIHLSVVPVSELLYPFIATHILPDRINKHLESNTDTLEIISKSLLDLKGSIEQKREENDKLIELIKQRSEMYDSLSAKYDECLEQLNIARSTMGYRIAQNMGRFKETILRSKK